MNLAFDSNGSLLLNDDLSLTVVDNQTAELSRLQMLVDITPGAYPYDEFFGLPFNSVVGKANITAQDISVFEKAINDALIFNNLLEEFNVLVTQKSSTMLQVDIIGTASDITWLYKTKAGKLIAVDKTIPIIEETNFIATTKYITSTGLLVYDIEFIFRKNKEQNGFEFTDEIEYSHRVYYTDPGSETNTSERVFASYWIPDDLKTLRLNSPIQSGKSIVIEVWPSAMSDTEIETNPYLLRK